MRRLLLALLLVAASASTPMASPVPQTIAFSARILDSGTPADGGYAFRFRLFGAAEGGEALWEEGQLTLTVNAGVVVHDLGSEKAIAPVVLTQGRLFLELEVNGTKMSPRVELRSVPFALRAGVADAVPRATGAPAPCTAERAGAIYFDDTTRRFLGCDGVGYVELGARLPTRLRQGASKDVPFPNTDGACGLSAGSPWTNVDGMVVKVDLPRETEIELGFTGSLVDHGAETVGLHCALRFLVDGAPVAGASPDWGHYLWSTANWTWHPTGSERRTTLAAGTHQITVQGRSGTCTAGADVTHLCLIPGASQTAVSLELNVLVP